MPYYLLPLDSTESHVWFDGLPEIARGYVEAAFFCGVLDWSGDGEPVEIDSAGPAMLDHDGRAALEADAVRFWIANAETLERATAGGAYDLEQAGRDLWFSSNGHGVGFFDRREIEPETRDALQNAARAFGERNLFAEPVAPCPLDCGSERIERRGEGWHCEFCDSPVPEGEEPDPADPDAWRVTLDFPADPLTPLERAAAGALEAAGAAAMREAARTHAGDVAAALEALEALAGTVPPADPLPRVGGAYGAPMGRPSYVLDPAERHDARRVTLDPGGYDSGGAYWGTGEPLWRVTGRESGACAYVRARSAREALAVALRSWDAALRSWEAAEAEARREAVRALRARREARGMADPLNRLRAIGAGAPPIAGIDGEAEA